MSFQYPVYFASEGEDIGAVLADVKRNDATGQLATATTGGLVEYTMNFGYFREFCVDNGIYITAEVGKNCYFCDLKNIYILIFHADSDDK